MHRFLLARRSVELPAFSHRWKNSLLRAGRAAPPSARPETSVVRISAWSLHRFPQPPAQYKQKSRGRHTSSAAATGPRGFLFYFLLSIFTSRITPSSQLHGSNLPASARQSPPVPDRSGAVATSEWCSL